MLAKFSRIFSYCSVWTVFIANHPHLFPHTMDKGTSGVSDAAPCVGLLNVDEEDEMKVSGYRRSWWRTALCWLCIGLTAGLLRLIMHWWRHWYLIATHEPCSLDNAEKVLVQEDYQGKHRTFYVECVEQLSIAELREPPGSQSKSAIDLEATFERATSGGDHGHDDVKTTQLLPVHFSSAQFKYMKNVRFFVCKQLRYAWDHQTKMFAKIKGLDVDVPCSYLHQQRGLAAREQLARRIVYGWNEIDVPYQSVRTLLCLEVLNPYYVFQIFSVVLWFTYDYYYYACVILLMSIFGITASIIQTKKNQDALRETVQNTGCALVLSDNGDVKEVPTQNLVPGDIIAIPTNGCTMQCDAVLLSGNCIVDESMLTGESVPVTKTPLPLKRDSIFDKRDHARHTLFCGTKVIQTRYIDSEKVLAVVINTGNITAKGGLIRSILYPPIVDYKFEQDSYKFIEFLGLIAMIGFIYTLVSKIMRDINPVKIAVESLDIITIVVPPALPAAMTVGRMYAQKRLKNNNIYCISPRSINVAGSIDCCCFDKTGTLTEDGLDMWGVVPKSVTNGFQIPIREIGRLSCDNFLFGMVTCHSITIMNGKRVGDPLDLKMFESTGWILEDLQDIPDSQKYGLIHPTIVRQAKRARASDGGAIAGATAANKGDECVASVHRQSSVNDLLADVGLLNGEANNDHGIVREFPFTSNLQRMSVITRRLSDNHYSVYCKGSPEKLQQLCDAATVPSNYSQQLAVFAKQGFRVIAMAYKPLSRKMNYTKAQRLSREAAECELEFLGFVVLENRLKPDTTAVIHSLTAANIRSIMVTGDNILTAVSVARDCGIVEESQAVVTVNVRQLTGDTKSNYELYYTMEMGNNNKDNDVMTKTMTTITSNGNGGDGGRGGGGGDHSNKRTITGGVTAAYNVEANDNNRDDDDDDDDDDDVYDTINNGDVASLNSASALQNSSSLTSVATCDTWTHRDVEMGFGDIVKAPALAAVVVADSSRSYRFAMVGDTWQIVREHFPDELRRLLTRGAIFARMSPEQKQALITELQGLDYCVAMCGDGANDCGALKVAHTGISLSETESAIASPFTSRNPTIACVPKIIQEGRAALVTSFGIFKYMAAYSMVQFLSVLMLYSIDSNLTDKQYLLIDLGLIAVFAFFFGKTEAYAGPLVKQAPLNSLISLTPLASLILHLLVVIAFQVAGWYHLHMQSWFVPFQLVDESALGCYENYTMFAISSFQYIILAFVFSKGAPYRKPIWSNVPLCLTLVINAAFISYLIVLPADWVALSFGLHLPPMMDFRYWMLAYGVCNFGAHLFVETVLVEYLLFKKVEVRKLGSSSARRYLQVEKELRASAADWPPITRPNYVETAELEAATTYVELRASQRVPASPPPNNALYKFFEVDIGTTPVSDGSGGGGGGGGGGGRFQIIGSQQS